MLLKLVMNSSGNGLVFLIFTTPHFMYILMPSASFWYLHYTSNSKQKENLSSRVIYKFLPQAVPNSFAQWINAWGQTEFVIAHPEGYELDEQFTRGAVITHNQQEALKDADFVYVKNWSSYHQYGQILNSDPSWMITNQRLAVTNHAKIMHCLPVRRNLVIADEVLDGPDSVVIREAGNRVWSAQAVLSEILRGLA